MLLIINYIAIFLGGILAILALHVENKRSGETGFSALGIIMVSGVLLSAVIAAVSLRLSHVQKQKEAELQIQEMEKVFTGQAKLLEKQARSLTNQSNILANQGKALGVQLDLLQNILRNSQPFRFGRFLILFDVNAVVEAGSDLHRDSLNLGAVAYFCTAEEALQIDNDLASLESLQSTCSGRVTGTFNNNSHLGARKGRAYSDGLELEIPANGVIVNSSTKNSLFDFQKGAVFFEIYLIGNDGKTSVLSRNFFERFSWAVELSSGSVVYRFDPESLKFSSITIEPDDPREASVLRADFDPEHSLR